MNDNTTVPLDDVHRVETLTELLRIGKDEMNFAEFPMTSLSDKPITAETSLKFEDQIYDDRQKTLISRKRIIEGSKEYGLPTATDDAVLLALIQLTKQRNGFAARELEFSRHELIQLLRWPNKGQSYGRIAQSLHRLAGVTYHFDNSWWDNRRKRWTTRIFGIIDNVDLNDSRERGEQGGPFTSRIIWNQNILDSFQSGYLRTLDFQLAIRLKHAISMRIYRFMGKRFHLRPEWTFDLKDFSYEHVGISRNYEGGTQIARKLQPAIMELENVGFLEPLAACERFVKKGRAWSIRLVRNAPALAMPSDEEPATNVDPSLVAKLVDRGVGRASAVRLVEQFPPAFLEGKIEEFDWEMTQPKPPKKPAGYLVDSIRRGYRADPDFITAAQRRKNEETRKAKEREAAEIRLRKQRQDAEERAKDQRDIAYWDALTPERQAELRATIDAEADPAQLAKETGPFKTMGQHIRRHAYIRRLLDARESTPPGE